MSAVTRVAALLLCRAAIVVAVLAVLTGCNREPYSRSVTGFSSLDKRTFYDFRDAHPSSEPPLDRAAARQVLAAVFPASLPETRQCRPGMIAPVIAGAGEGSFTAPGMKQSVYLIEDRECDRDPARSTRRLVVFTAGTISANATLAFGDTILGVYDLNGDGKQELLVRGDSSSAGEFVQNAMLVEFDKEKLVPVEDLGQVYDDACDTAATSKSVTARVVYVLPGPPGQRPRFTVEVYRAPCPAHGKSKSWARVGER